MPQPKLEDMVSMKKPPEVKEAEKATAVTGAVSDGETYPYGSTIEFEKNVVTKMPALAKAKKGDKVYLSAMAHVKSIVIRENEHGPDEHEVTLQVEKAIVTALDDMEAGFDEATNRS